MAITRPQLPPRAGYVEVEVDGVRKYRSLSTGLLLEEEEAPGPSTEEQLKLQSAQIQALSDRNEFLEDCIAEMAGELYA